MTTHLFPEAVGAEIRSMNYEDMQEWLNATPEEKKAKLVPISKFSTEELRRLVPMTWTEHIATVLFLAYGVPNAPFTIPPTLFLIGRFIVGNVSVTFLYFGLFVLLPLTLMPQKFVPSLYQSWLSRAVAKYFSAIMITETYLDPSEARLVVAPPHGVFPYGNLMACVAWPLAFGCCLRGLASSTALRAPIIKQVLRGIGVIDASRANARRFVEDGSSLGISTGGVAEVFEMSDTEECIVLRERKGLIKLAIRTGAPLVPSYVFGNTKILHCWCGQGLPRFCRDWLERISRKVGLALVVIYGRFGLPIPIRVPLLAVAGVPIPTKHIKCEDPTPQQVDEIQEKLLDAMEKLFDKYKGIYGWEDKRLVIK